MKSTQNTKMFVRLRMGRVRTRCWNVRMTDVCNVQSESQFEMIIDGDACTFPVFIA